MSKTVEQHATEYAQAIADRLAAAQRYDEATSRRLAASKEMLAASEREENTRDALLEAAAQAGQEQSNA